MSKRGFSLIELLVVIAVTGILVSLLLPAVQAAREAARRMQCGSNQKQIGVALHIYHDVDKVFPSGSLLGGNPLGGQSSWSWIVSLLPYVEQTALRDALAPYSPDPLSVALTVPAKLQRMQTRLSVLICPSDTGDVLNGDRKLDPTGLNVAVAKANYLGSQGMLNTCPAARGIFCINSRVAIRDILDGTSNTLLVGERQSGDLKKTGRHAAGIWVGATASSGFGLPDQSPIGFHGCTRWRMQSGIQEDNLAIQGPSFCFSSRHPGGAQFALCDGSVRFISESIDSKVGNLSDPTTWGIYQKLSDRDDGQTVEAF